MRTPILVAISMALAIVGVLVLPEQASAAIGGLLLWFGGAIWAEARPR